MTSQDHNFWQQLKKPIIGLSPMDGVTDFPFRLLQKKYGQPAVVYTEFTSVEGVCHGADRLLTDFLYDESQRPIVSQIYGTTPKFFRQTATLLCQLGFDGIDINMGCPAKNVAHSGAGAALIETPKLAQQIVRETKAGVQDWLDGKTAADCADITEEIAQQVAERHKKLPKQFQAKRNIPVSVKTRIGYHQPVIEDWIPALLETEPAVIAIHGRTLKQHYSGEANWENIAKAAELVHETDTLILGNGDIQSKGQAEEYCQKYNVDGVLIGRASFGNPYVFQEESPLYPRLFEIALEHTKVYEKTYSQNEKYSFLPMRKHLGWYVRSIPNASEIRLRLFQTNSSQEVKQIFKEYGLI